MTENACGPSQDQVNLNMPKDGNEENTSPQEGGTSHLSSPEKDQSSPLEGETPHVSSHGDQKRAENSYFSEPRSSVLGARTFFHLDNA